MNRINRELLSGSFYIGIAKYSNILFQLLVTAILARLLTPSDFGIVAIATVFIVFFNILSDIGIGPAVIQRKDLDTKELNHLFSFNVYLGFFLALLFFLLSWPISALYNDNEDIKKICQILSLLVLFTCFRTIPINILYRDKCFKFVAFITLFIQIIVGLISIFAAYNGWGFYSLIFPQVLSAFLQAIMFYSKCNLRFVPGISPMFVVLKKIFSYSVYSFLSSIIYYFSRNMDKMLIGKFLGAEPLGYYEKSYRLMFMPIDNITFVITPVMHPLFSNFQNNLKEIADKYLRIVQLLAYVSFPLSVFLFFSSKELILILFGDQWLQSVPTFRILSLSVSVQMLTTTVGSIYNASNATKIGFFSSCISTLLMVSGFLITIFLWGTIESVAIGLLITQILFFFLNYMLLMKVLGCIYNRFVCLLLKPLYISLLLSFIYYIIDIFVSNLGLLLALLVKVFVFLFFLLVVFHFATGFSFRSYIVNKFQLGKKGLTTKDVS